MVNNTALYGGFIGIETKLSQRVSDPILNGTVLSGDLMGNDTSTPFDDPNTYLDNSMGVCVAATNIGGGTVLDGFTITGATPVAGFGSGVISRGRPRLRNLLFRANYGGSGGGLAVLLPQAATTEPYVISDCVFLQNLSFTAGGMYVLGVTNQQIVIVTNCQFYENQGGFFGGGLLVDTAKCFVENCTFAWNSSLIGGGIAVRRPSTMRISRCEVLENTATGSGDTGGGAGLVMDDGGRAAADGDLKVEVLQSVFWNNRAPTGWGGAIEARGSVSNKRLYILNSCIVSNVGYSTSGAFCLDYCWAWIENSILWGNPIRVGPGSTLTVRTTCLAEANTYPGNGNINADPKFVDLFGGNLRLQQGSPCIDRGNNYMDYYQTLPSLQLLPATDLDGNRRIVDGNGDGTEIVDMGAYEFQGQ